MRNLILTGFMGTGKSSVGQTVARQLGRPFADMDAELEARAGKTIPRIFAEEGEPAFRQMETALCTELSARQGLVIATGGGTLVDPHNRARMMQSGTVICLNCAVEEILHRVQDNPARPLLEVADRRAEVERLLETRCQAYRAFPWQLDTTNLSINEVAARVIELAGFVTLPVRFPGGQHDIHVGNGALTYLGGILHAAGVPKGSRVAVVSNPIVAPLYGGQVEKALHAAGLPPFVCSMPDGEQFKTLATVASLYDQFLAGGLDRGDTVLSLGGGVTGDVAGFAAASYMRGVRFVQVPTTLLAMVDASVGGKTGVDLPQGKNLVGAFYQPAVVVIDPTVLATLPAEELRSGMAEVIKHGLIGDPELFCELEAGASQPPAPDGQLATRNLPSAITRALRVKIAIVEQDPLERDRRAVLNLGHTIGHALERLTGFTLRHGEAVSIGMAAAARIAVELGQACPSLVERLEALLSAWGLPVQCLPFEAAAIWQAMAHDKKRRGHSLRWVLPLAVGTVEITEEVTPGIVSSVLHEMGAR